MGSTTANGKLPYPVGTDRVMDGDNAMQSLAEAVDGLVICYAVLYRNTPLTGAGTGNIWMSDLTVARKYGNINADPTGVTINVSGDYEVTAITRQQANNGTNVLLATHVGQNSSVIAVGTMVVPVQSQYLSPVAHAYAGFVAGDKVQFGYFQAVASQINVLNGYQHSSITVRLVRPA